MSLLAGAGQAKASPGFTLMDSLNCSSAFRTWSRASTGTVTLQQTGAYDVSTSVQLSPESLRETSFSVEVLYNELKGTIVFPGIPVSESDMLGFFAVALVALVVLGFTFGRKSSRVSA